MKVQGQFKMQAHIISGVVMDIAVVKVSHSVGCDIDATALRSARARSSSIGALTLYRSWVELTLSEAPPVMFSPISPALPG